MPILDAIFGFDSHLLWWQECLRAILIFVYGLTLVRLAGRRIFGKWAALDIVVSIVVGSNMSRALTGSAPLFGTLAATTLMVGLHWVLSHALARSPALSRVLEGGAVRLGADGRAAERELHRHAISPNDLAEGLRAAGLSAIGEARLVTLEPSGKITVLKGE